MAQVFVIAEAGSSWRFFKAHPDSGKCGDEQIDNAYRMIRAAKECGADAVKFQWCSDAKALALRRNEPQYAEAYKYVEYPREWLALFKAEADRVGIEFMCTAFLPQDVAVVAPLVKRFKVAAKECYDKELKDAIRGTASGRQVIVSHNPDHWDEGREYPWLCGISYGYQVGELERLDLYCVSEYPCPLEHLKLGDARLGPDSEYGPEHEGLSDHTGHVLTGAVAVGAGARVIESHIRLEDTPDDNPDYPHSLIVDQRHRADESYWTYIANVRLAERMCG